ncbi:zinc metalloprotease ProA [Legionella israelensis]|uniref:Neutral metalloproteinase n=1 Tax=Legionella israelensis TaxID=454 RepID=A0A0W0V2R7_9GAMM|nr:M4 family metallopeptidase [Legionella israelensis]KTD14427.1 zinc metalloproteinase precursor [Legionella israelensis]QBS09359.1 peptidase M4 family protein [Legionella israelensis]SCX90586.1 Msp peptidase. Metallo peptidase. MEROPS family M04 [Legionella israelensis DSM 19235]STX60259.1 zinc metalloprotease [Legionella israelensis]
MHPNFYLSPLAAALAVGLASPAKAAEPVNLRHSSMNSVLKTFQLALPGMKQTSTVSANSLHAITQHTDKNQVTHVRMQQHYAGIPVFGGYAITHSKHSTKSLAAAKADVTMNGTIYRGLSEELGHPSSAFIKEAPEVLERFKESYKAHQLSEEKVTPMVYIDEQHKAHWAYKVSVLVHYSDKIPERPTAILDAKTEKPFIQWNDVKTERAKVKGKGFGGNHKTGEYQFGKDYPLLDLTRDDSQEICYMENTDVKVVDMGHDYSSSNKPMEFSCKSNQMTQQGDSVAYWTGYKADGYDAYNGAMSPTNDALYAGYVIKHLYHDWYGVEALKKNDGSPMQLVMRVHYGFNYENAYWDGKQMTFGDGGSMLYPLVSLGVGSHEISHGFTEQHSDLMYFGQSGGMNESFSDMAAQAAEYYSTGHNTWQIGPEIMKEDSGWEALRYMDQPSKDGMSIDRADQYYGGLDVHYSSGVYNHLYYLLAHQPGWDARKAFDVMVKANMDYWTPYTDFDEGGCGVISAAQDLGYPVKDVIQSLEEVAINTSSCLKTQ